MTRAPRSTLLAAVAVAAVAASGCAAHWAYRQAEDAFARGEWDLAVARYTKAVEKDKKNIGYRIALENARIQASRQHYAQARKHMAADELGPHPVPLGAGERSAHELLEVSGLDPEEELVQPLGLEGGAMAQLVERAGPAQELEDRAMHEERQHDPGPRQASEGPPRE